MLEVLSNSVFRRLYTAQVTSLVGTGLTTVALALLAFELGGQNAGQVLGIVLGLKMLAYVAAAPIFSGFWHILPRRGTMITLDLIRAALICLLPFVTEVWQVYVLTFVISVAAAGFSPAYQATIPDVLQDERLYTRALSLSQMSYDIERIMSPTFAALALLFMQFNTLFFLDSVTFLISAGILTTLRFPVNKSADRGDRTIANILYGLQKYLMARQLRALLLFFVSYAMAHAMVLVNTVVIVRYQMGLGESETGLAFASAGVGSIVASLSVPRLADRLQIRSILVSGAVALACGLFLIQFATSLSALFPAFALIGMGGALINTQAGRVIVANSDESDRPALFAAHFALSHACWLVGYPLAGFLGTQMSMGNTALLLMAVASVSAVVGAAYWQRKAAP